MVLQVSDMPRWGRIRRLTGRFLAIFSCYDLAMLSTLRRYWERLGSLWKRSPGAKPGEPSSPIPVQDVEDTDRKIPLPRLANVITRMIADMCAQGARHAPFPVPELQKIVGAMRGFGYRGNVEPPTRVHRPARRCLSLSLDQRESQEQVLEAANLLTPPEFKVQVGSNIAGLLLENAKVYTRPLRLSWGERGFVLPRFEARDSLHLRPLQVGISFGNIELLLEDLSHDPSFEQFQLLLHRAVVEALPWIVGRDFVASHLPDLPASALVRGKHILLSRMRHGLALPALPLNLIEPDQELEALNASAPPLAVTARLSLLLACVPSDLRPDFQKRLPEADCVSTSELFKCRALAELEAAVRSGQCSRGYLSCCRSLVAHNPEAAALRVLRRWYFRHPISHFEQACRKDPAAMVALIQRHWNRPARSPSNWERLAVISASLKNARFSSALGHHLGQTPVAHNFQPELVEQVLRDLAWELSHTTGQA